MGEVYFYQLSQHPLEVALPALIERALAQGWRVAVRGTDAGRLDWLDQKLWLGPDDRFLPHGLAGGPHDAMQPVLLTTKPDAANRPDCLMSVDGADISEADAGGCARVCILFDGADPPALDRARGQWKALTGAGIRAKYWSEESGRWEMKAER